MKLILIAHSIYYEQLENIIPDKSGVVMTKKKKLYIYIYIHIYIKHIYYIYIYIQLKNHHRLWIYVVFRVTS